jgi:hypothetical protein
MVDRPRLGPLVIAMAYIAYPPNWWMVTDLATSLTYIAEPARRGSRKLRWSRMNARSGPGDESINLARVPLYLRRAAHAHFQLNGEVK